MGFLVFVRIGSRTCNGCVYNCARGAVVAFSFVTLSRTEKGVGGVSSQADCVTCSVAVSPISLPLCIIHLLTSPYSSHFPLFFQIFFYPNRYFISSASFPLFFREVSACNRERFEKPPHCGEQYSWNPVLRTLHVFLAFYSTRPLRISSLLILLLELRL